MKRLLIQLCVLTLSGTILFADDKSREANSGHGADKASMTEHLKGLTGDKFDAAFLTHMTQHHRSAIKMAKLAESQAQNPALKNLSAEMEQKQTKDIDQMTALLQANYASEKPEPMSANDPSMKKMQRQMDQLKNMKGTEFDQRFISSMIIHHEEGIKMAEMATDRANSQQVRTLAQKMIEDQKNDIETLKSLKTAR